jgi:hypothetical protein
MKDKHAVAMGKKGGKARAAKLSKERRVEIAKLGYEAGIKRMLSGKHKSGQSAKTGENKV